MSRREKASPSNSRRRLASELAQKSILLWVAGAIFHPFFLGGWNGDLKAGLFTFNVPFLILSGLIPLAAWVWLFWIQESDRQAGKTLAELQALTPGAFEEWVAARFVELGYSTKLTPNQGDHGIDIIIDRQGEHAIVQCKNYKSWSVGEPILRDLFGAMHDSKATKAYLVTTGRLTEAAAKWVKGKPIEVWDGERLAKLSQAARVQSAKEAQPAPAEPGQVVAAPQTESSVVTPGVVCPKCGAQLVERQNRKTGEAFLGCSTYPACRYTQPLERARA